MHPRVYYLIIYTLVIYTLVINLYLAIPQSQVQKVFAQHSTFGIKLEIDNKFLDYAYKSAGTVASGSAESGAASEAEMRAAKTAAAVKEQAEARRAAEAKAKAKAMAKAKAKAKASEKEERRLLAEAAKVAKAAAEAEAEAKQEQQHNGGETGALLSVAGVKVRTHPPFALRISSDIIVCCSRLLLCAY